MKYYISIVMAFIFLQGCSEAKQDAVVDRQTERVAEKLMEKVAEDNAEALAISESKEPKKKGWPSDVPTDFDPHRGLKEKIKENE